MDQPSIDGVNTYFVCKLAAEAGLKVALSGLGGDELFAGYPNFTRIPAIVQRLAPLRKISAIGAMARNVYLGLGLDRIHPKLAGLLEYGATYEGAYLLCRSLYGPWELTSVLPPEIVAEGLLELAPLSRFKKLIDTVRTPQTRVTVLELCSYMRNQLLRDADWASMAHSVELRVPFLDMELLRHVFDEANVGQAYSKKDMAATPLLPLPAEILTRKKTGFEIPVASWHYQQQQPPQRGLREWARYVHQRFAGLN
jgi:asparagine synthase (glutamine-hydrolysing)